MSDDLSGFSLMDLFRSEAEGQVATLSEGLIALEETANPATAIEPLMRAAHSLKGAARIVGLEPAVRIAHSLEDAFVAAQAGEFKILPPHVDTMLGAVDLLAQIAQLDEAGLPSWEQAHEPRLVATIAALDAIRTTPSTSASAPASAPEPEPPTSVEAESPPEPPVEPVFHDPAGPPVPARLAAGDELAELGGESQRAEIERPTHGSPPSAAGDAAGRVVRVSAESLSKMMALAGESLVQARQLRPFVDGLMALKRQQAAIGELLRALEAQAGPGGDGTIAADLILRAKAEAERSGQALTENVDSFDDFTRRSEDLAGRLHHEVIASRMRPISDGVRGFPRMVRDVARNLGKQVRFEVRGEATGVDRDILDKLEAPLNHLIRNAIDHAIEGPEQRQAARKDPVGTIRLEARHSAGMLQITVSDDGRGVDLDRLRAKVIDRGLATEVMAGRLSEAELLEFLFLPGFSTKDAVTEISGRGVGLDVVQDMVRTVGGIVRVASKFGRGTRFTLQLPITMSVVRALLVRIAGEPYAFPLNRIDRIVRIDRADLRQLEGRSHFLIGDELVGIVDAVEVFGFHDPGIADRMLSVVVVSDRNLRFGMVVEAFLGERDLEVRPLDPRLGKPPDINSASVLDDGWPVLIVDVEDLVRSIDNMLGGRRFKALPSSTNGARAVRRSKRILVVDDSITVRELERQLLEGRGYQVDVAVDGVDGWNAIRVGDYHLVISDVDMPRMDGITLVRSIKQDARLRSIPVVIVSYKDREEDRMRGLDAGADGYLTKSSFHDRTFLDAVADLIGEAEA